MPGKWNFLNEKDDNISAPASSAEAVVPHATNPLPHYTRAIYFGVGGTVVVRMVDDNNDTTFTDVPAGTVLPVRVSHVRSGPASMVALF